jgi:hypothetical protein
MRGFFSLIVIPTWCLAQARPQQPAAPFSTAEDSLKMFLQTYLRTPPSNGDKTTQYFSAFVDLNGDGTQEAIVYLTGQSWCGSGGCTTVILARNRSSWRVLTHMTITRPPIRVLSKASNGWRNISVWVQGGGIQPSYEAELRFDGKTYPSNPSVPPARRSAGKAIGEVVIRSSQSGTRLYP